VKQLKHESSWGDIALKRSFVFAIRQRSRIEVVVDRDRCVEARGVNGAWGNLVTNDPS
jgi:hypothetical protein